jgi:hypothetical protein
MIDLIRSEEEKYQELFGKISKMFSEEIEGDHHKKVQRNERRAVSARETVKCQAVTPLP